MDLESRSFLKLVQRRRSIRSYRPDGIDRDMLLRCLEAARLAPSACNSQPWTFIIIDDPVIKDRVASLTSDGVLPLNHFTRQAPVLVAVVVEKPKLSARFGGAVKRRPLPWIDLGIAVEHFCLQATAEGLGTCILGWFKELAIKTLLGVPGNKRIGLLMTVGYPKTLKGPVNNRKEIVTITRHNHYQEDL